MASKLATVTQFPRQITNPRLKPQPPGAFRRLGAMMACDFRCTPLPVCRLSNMGKVAAQH